MSTPLQMKLVRNALFAAAVLGAFSAPKLLAQAASTQIWTGITPPPENGASYTLNDVGGGIWDGATANWANNGVGTATSYYAFAPGPGRIATFLPKTDGYTVTLAYNTPTLRALSLSGGNSNGKVMIKSNAAHTITFNGTNSYILVAAGRELTIGENSALKGDFVLHANGGGTLRWSGAAAAYQETMTLSAGTLVVDADAGSRMGSAATFLIQNGAGLQYNGATALASTLEVREGTLGGSGRINAAVSIGAGAVLSPGEGVGAQEYADLTLAGGGRYEWQIASWLDEVDQFDSLRADQLNVSADFEAPFVITLQSIDGGALGDFDAGLARQWRLLEWENGPDELEIDSFFTLDAESFEAMHFLDAGRFSLQVADNALTLSYAPVPEVSSVVAMALGGLLFLCLGRGRLVAKS